MRQQQVCPFVCFIILTNNFFLFFHTAQAQHQHPSSSNGIFRRHLCNSRRQYAIRINTPTSTASTSSPISITTSTTTAKITAKQQASNQLSFVSLMPSRNSHCRHLHHHCRRANLYTFSHPPTTPIFQPSNYDNNIHYSSSSNNDNNDNYNLENLQDTYKSLQRDVSKRVRQSIHHLDTVSVTQENERDGEKQNEDTKSTIDSLDFDNTNFTSIEDGTYGGVYDDDDEDIENAAKVKQMLKDISKRAKSSMKTITTVVEAKYDFEFNEKSSSSSLVDAASRRMKAVLLQDDDNNDTLTTSDEETSMRDNNDTNNNGVDDDNNNIINKNEKFKNDEIMAAILNRATQTLNKISTEEQNTIKNRNTNETNTPIEKIIQDENHRVRNEKEDKYNFAQKDAQKNAKKLLNMISSRAKKNLASPKSDDMTSFYNDNDDDNHLVTIASQRAMKTLEVEYDISNHVSLVDALTNRTKRVIGKRSDEKWVQWNDDDDSWKKNDLWEKDEWDKNDW